MAMKEISEIGKFIKVWLWLSVFLSLCYCYVLPKFVPKGVPRLLCILPIVCLFLDLPLHIDSIHLVGTISFFIAWLANFKLLLFAFGKGPLSSDPSISLSRFIAITCLPIKIQKNCVPKSHGQNGSSVENRVPEKKNKSQKSPLNYATKVLFLGVVFRAYKYSEHIHTKLIWVMYCIHIYVLLEMILFISATVARALLGVDLEPQFDEPYLSSSLQDFWGRRWNIMVTSILRPTVYEPILKGATPLVGRKWAPLPAVMGTFVVSAIMHELIFYYMGRLSPTWDVTCFFLLHGICLVAEIAVKKTVSSRRFHLPRLITGPLTVAFVTATVFWLFLPAMLRFKVDVRSFEEYAAIQEFAKNVGRAFISKSSPL